MEVSNAGRVVYPEDGITKGDVVDYYERVGDLMLPHLRLRALTVERYPKGVADEGFIQKNTPDHYPEDLFERHEVEKEDGGITVYPVIDSISAVTYLANQGVITFHVPPVRVVDEQHPDWVVWDLDPPSGRTDLVRAAAREIRDLLADLGISAGLMTSGSNGYHLRTPIEPTVGTDEAGDLARGVAALAAAAEPDLMTIAFRKKERGGKVFVDWLRNAAHATAVSPWSLRARRGAPVATPISWEALGSVEPDGIRIASVPEDVDAGAWNDMVSVDLGHIVPLVGQAIEKAGIEIPPFDRFRT